MYDLKDDFLYLKNKFVKNVFDLEKNLNVPNQCRRRNNLILSENVPDNLLEAMVISAVSNIDVRAGSNDDVEDCNRFGKPDKK